MKTNKVRVEQRPAAAALWELNGLAETERDERDKYHWIKPAQTRPNRINREWSRIDANDSGDRPVKPDQTESNQIKPNQTCEGEVPMAHGVARERDGVRRGFRIMIMIMNDVVNPGQPQSNRINRQWPRIAANDSGDRPVKPDQTKSNQIKPVRGKYLWHTELHGSEMVFGGVLGSNPVKPSQTRSQGLAGARPSRKVKPSQTRKGGLS
jgi:hypothetical protein